MGAMGSTRTKIATLAAAALAVAILSSAAATPAVAQEAASETDQTYHIGVDAYTYLYPLVLMDLTRRQATNVDAGHTVGRGPMNTFVHVREYPPGNYRDVVRPNFDTLYSSAWLDLTSGPVVVSTPDTGGRYFLLPMLDMWTDVFACPGTRTTGDAAARYVVVPPGWRGELPADMQRVDAPTPYVWIIGRTQTNGPGDYAAVHAFQDQITLTPLDPGTPATSVAIDPGVDMKTPPLFQVAALSAERFFSAGLVALAVNPPHLTDQPILAQMRRIGLEAGKPFDWSQLDAGTRTALERAAHDALARIRGSYNTNESSSTGWKVRTQNTGVFGNNYLNRASVAMFGLGANLPEDAIYPNRATDSQGQPLTGERSYRLRFERGQFPPVRAFWSLTVYDKDGFPVENALQRYALGDRDPLQLADDGSLTLYIQHDRPAGDLEANWLPTPAGEFLLQMRLYWPAAEALDGRWFTPDLVTVE